MRFSDQNFMLTASRLSLSLPGSLHFDCLRLYTEIINMMMTAVGFFRNSSSVYSRSESSKINSSSIVVFSVLAIL